MTIDSATVVELVNFAAGILLLAVAIYAQIKLWGEGGESERSRT